MSRLIGVYGASGFGREVMPLLQGEAATCVFIDDGGSTHPINGYDVIPWEDFVARPESDKAVTIAIADSRVRQTLASRCKSSGIRMLPVKAPNVIEMQSVVVGEGAILSPFVTLTSNIQIGTFFHANIYSYVAHDCVIGDFVTFAPRVSCNGNIRIEDHVYIGTGAVLRQGTPHKPLMIGKGAIVGMGAVVTKDVPAGTTVVGNPARPLISA